MPRSESPNRPANRLLARLPEADYGELSPHLAAVNLRLGQVLYEDRAVIAHAYFPAGAVASSLALMEDGDAIEVATVGVEGLVGHVAVSGAETSPHRVIVQIAGAALRVRVATLRELAWRSGPLRRLLAAYVEAYESQVSQSVACNGLHRLEQRCCRWLLMSRDRALSDDIRLTHETLSIVLGARRASVTGALGPLHEGGLVSLGRGRILILDSTRLEARSCECYRVVRDEYDRLMDRAMPDLTMGRAT